MTAETAKIIPLRKPSAEGHAQLLRTVAESLHAVLRDVEAELAEASDGVPPTRHDNTLSGASAATLALAMAQLLTAKNEFVPLTAADRQAIAACMLLIGRPTQKGH